MPFSRVREYGMDARKDTLIRRACKAHSLSAALAMLEKYSMAEIVLADASGLVVFFLYFLR